MAIQIKTCIRYEYQCDTCGIDYLEQRNPEESQFFTACQNFGCVGTYQLVKQTEFTYEQFISDPVIEPIIDITDSELPNP